MQETLSNTQIEVVEQAMREGRERRENRETAEARCYELALELLKSGISAQAVTDAFGFIAGTLYEARNKAACEATRLQNMGQIRSY